MSNGTAPGEFSGSTLLISDLHLSPAAPATTARFLRFLAGPAQSAKNLTILGDLFDAWAGDDDLADPFNTGIVTALRRLSDSGVAVAFMAGNRDFLIGNDFAASAGLTLLPDPYRCHIAGTPTLLTHGDQLCTDDIDYQRFRSEVHSPAWRTRFLARPLAERKAAVAALRASSEAEKKSKSLTIMDVNASAVATKLKEYGVHHLIHGHTHHQGLHTGNPADAACQRWVLGDWQADRASALACNAASWRFFN